MLTNIHSLDLVRNTKKRVVYSITSEVYNRCTWSFYTKINMFTRVTVRGDESVSRWFIIQDINQPETSLANAIPMRYHEAFEKQRIVYLTRWSPIYYAFKNYIDPDTAAMVFRLLIAMV
jgi:hypothetical protein